MKEFGSFYRETTPALSAMQTSGVCRLRDEIFIHVRRRYSSRTAAFLPGAFPVPLLQDRSAFSRSFFRQGGTIFVIFDPNLAAISHDRDILLWDRRLLHNGSANPAVASFLNA